MKITEVIKKCLAGSENLRIVAEENNNGAFLRGRAWSCDECANMLEETVHEIQNELGRFKAEAENEELSKAMRADAAAMAVIVEWILGEKE